MSIFCWPLSLLLAGCPAPGESKYETVKVTQSIDCQGQLLNKGKLTELRIVSSNVTIRRCKINGSIRIVGLGVYGEAEAVRKTSLSLGHTERDQAAAPTNTKLWKLTITGHGRIPVYIAPGVTNTTLSDSVINGKTDSVALYLDAESAGNVIRSNTFNVGGEFILRQLRFREAIAVDGSANNQIIGNVINKANSGGIYLYRNCGEGGTVRHQKPQGNLIAGNTIDITGITEPNHGIWLGSRNGSRLYCSEDNGYPFGSSKNDADFADKNTVRNNVFIGSELKIKDDGKGNQVSP